MDSAKQPSGLSPTYVFHGTVPGAAAQIDSHGLQFREFEPSFCTDLLISTAKYANLASNPLFKYRGGSLDAAEKLAEQGHIAKAGGDELLAAAARFWDERDSSCRLFVISTENWRPVVAPHGTIGVDVAAREVRGGLIKWLERHLTLVSPDRVAEADRLSAEFVAGTLLGSVDWRSKRVTAVVPKEDLAWSFPSSPSFRRWIHAAGLKLDRIVDPSTCPAEVADLIPQPILLYLLELTRAARIGSAIRRAMLSTLRNRGYAMIKTDFRNHEVAQASLFWEPAELARRIGLLRLAVTTPAQKPLVDEAVFLLTELDLQSAYGLASTAVTASRIEAVSEAIWTSPGA